MGYTRFALFFCFIAMWFGAHGKRVEEFEIEIPEDQVPSCGYGENWVYCFWLEAADMHMLQQLLQEAANFAPSFSVAVYYSDGAAIPTDVFKNYTIDNVILQSCRLPSMPYELLSSIESPLQNLLIQSNNFSNVEASASDFLLPFSEFLNELVLESTNIQQIDSDFLQQYKRLQFLELEHNDLETIGSELLGMESLLALEYDFNRVSSVESGAFMDLKNLQFINLSNNNLTTLQEDAFLGIEMSPIYEVNLSYNPWNCSCDLQWLKDWLNDRTLTKSSGAVCAYPTVGYFNDVDFCL